MSNALVQKGIRPLLYNTYCILNLFLAPVLVAIDNRDVGIMKQRWRGIWPAAISVLTKSHPAAPPARQLSSSISSEIISRDGVNHVQRPATSSIKSQARANYLTWTAEERDLVAEQRRQGRSVRDIWTTHFQYRSLKSVQQCSCMLNQHPKWSRPDAWTEVEEERVLKLRDEGYGIEHIANLMPNRTWNSISTCLRRLRVRRPQDARHKFTKSSNTPVTDLLVDTIRYHSITLCEWQNCTRNSRSD